MSNVVINFSPKDGYEYWRRLCTPAIDGTYTTGTTFTGTFTSIEGFRFSVVSKTDSSPWYYYKPSFWRTVSGNLASYDITDLFTISYNSNYTQMTISFDVDDIVAVADVMGGEYYVYYRMTIEELPVPDFNNMFHVWLPTDENLVDISESIFISSGSSEESDEPVQVLQYFFSLRKWWYEFTSELNHALVAGKYTYPDIVVDVVTEYLFEIDCGSVDVEEEFEDFRDYSPYVKAKVYAPFVGFISVDVGRIMGNSVQLKYQCDILSGICVAQIIVEYDNVPVIIAQGNGKMAYDLPIKASSASDDNDGTYALLTASMLGDKIPYVMLSYNDSVGSLGNEGYFSSEEVTVGSVDGFIKYNDIHVSGIDCTMKELKEIERLLHEGIIV